MAFSHREDWRTGSIPELPLLRMQKFKTQKGASMAEAWTLKELRESKKMTQAELAEQFSVSSRTIQNMEEDSGNIKNQLLKKYLLFFDKDYNDIFLGKKYENFVRKAS